jgi:putative transposase
MYTNTNFEEIINQFLITKKGQPISGQDSLLLGYSRQAYYQSKKYEQQTAYEGELIIAEVLKHRELLKYLGTRKLLGKLEPFLKEHQFGIGRDGLNNLLRNYGLLVRKRKRKGCITTYSKHIYRKYPNIIKGFVPTAANQLWVSDITYIHIGNGFGYLSIITDQYSHKIVGFCLYKTLEAKGPLLALKMAMDSADNLKNLIHHSDRGVQYCCGDYVKILKDAQIKISMTEQGDPLENAVAERVNGILKIELLEKVYPNFIAAQEAIAKAISIYNYYRPHNSINDLTPVEAHQMNGYIPKKWKNYYQIKQQEKEG